MKVLIKNLGIKEKRLFKVPLIKLNIQIWCDTKNDEKYISNIVRKEGNSYATATINRILKTWVYYTRQSPPKKFVLKKIAKNSMTFLDQTGIQLILLFIIDKIAFFSVIAFIFSHFYVVFWRISRSPPPQKDHLIRVTYVFLYDFPMSFFIVCKILDFSAIFLNFPDFLCRWVCCHTNKYNSKKLTRLGFLTNKNM